MHTGSQMALNYANMKDLMAGMAIERVLWTSYLFNGGDPTIASTFHVDDTVDPKEENHGRAC